MPSLRSLPPILLLLVACSGGDSAAPEPEPDRNPASLGVHGGDNQTADPGTALPTAPAVLVKDAGGRGVAGVGVTFSVLSGGGSVANSTATTGSDGVANAGSWTLGPQSGPNTLEARAGTLAAVTFHAQGVTTPRLLADTVIAAAGATLRLGAGSAWDGLELAIPSGSFEGPSRWTFRVDPTLPLPQLPAGVLITSPPLSITTDQLRAARLMTLRAPVTRQPGYVHAAILHDPLRNIIEVLPMFGGDANSILVGVTHLNRSLLVGRGSGDAALQVSAAGSPVLSGMFTVAIPAGSLRSLGSVMPRLSDVLQIAEGGSYLFRDGHGPATALLNLLAKVGHPGISLGTLFKPVAVPGMHIDTASLAGVIAIARRYQAESGALTPVFNGMGSLLGPLAPPVRDSLTDVNLRAGMLLNLLPQMMLFVKRIVSAPYATTDVSFSVAIGAGPSGVDYVDPTAPQVAKYLQALGGQGYASRMFQAVEDAFPTDAEAIVAMGNSFVFPLERYVDIVQKILVLKRLALAAEAQFPQVFVELRNAANMDWVSIPNGGVARSDSAEIRVRCTQCPDALPVDADPQLQEAIAFDPASGQIRSRSRIPGSIGFLLGPMLANLPNGSITQLIGGLLSRMNGPASPAAPGAGVGPAAMAAVGQPVSRMLVPLNLPMQRMAMQLDPGSQVIQRHARADLGVRNALLGASGVIEWRFGDATAPVTGVGGDSTQSHNYNQKGTFTVEATLLQAGKRVAGVTGTVIVRDSFTVDPVADTVQADSLVRFAARPHGDVPASARYVWSFGDSTPPLTLLNDSLATHVYRSQGTYTVTVELWDATANLRHGIATATVMVVQPAFVHVSVALGGTHTCAVAPDGAAWCWGKNNRGQLGDGTTLRSTRPVKVLGGRAFKQVATGAEHTCALTTAGAAWCWGDHVYGQLGDGSPFGPQSPPALQPVAVQGAPTLVSISVGNRSTCGRTAGGQVWCWGWNGHTQIGDGTSTNRIVAVPITIGVSVGSISVGLFQTCAAPTGASGHTYCWGDNGKDNIGEYLVDYSPQVWGSNLLGTGSNEKTLYDPRSVVNLGLPWHRVSVGTGYACALDLAGAASCWGVNGYGQLGNNTTQWRSSPALVSGGQSFTTIGTGGAHSCGVTAAGEAWCWGRNTTGQLGTGTAVNSPVPVRSAIGIGRVLQLSVGSASTCALTEVGDVWCWGYNGDGGLGDGTLVTRQNPVKVVP